MTSATSKRSKAIALAEVQGLIAGTQKHFPNGSFTLGKTAFTSASLVAALEGYEPVIARLNAAHAALQDAAAARLAMEATLDPIIRDYRNYLRATFSLAATELADFGMHPVKARTPLNSDQRALATERMRATRKARGTKGPKQKLAIKGDVAGVVVTPVSAASVGPK
jgi:alpha-D-ribose 1-methylphosphonate 5-triphosphate synthase subunit PhnG